MFQHVGPPSPELVEALKDSGARQHFETGSVRDTSEGKGDFSLIPPYAEMAYACILQDGAMKYAARNWEKGQPVSRYITSARRHLAKYVAGLRDEPHLWQAFWNIGGAIFTTIMVHLGLLPSELYDMPNHTSADQPPALGKYEIDRLNKFLGKETK